MKINAFRIGLVGTLGVGVGLLVLNSISNLSTVITYIIGAVFLSLGLDPVVSLLERRGLKRPLALTAVMLAVLALVAGLLWAVIPLLVSEITRLVSEIPATVTRLQDTRWINTVQQNLPWIDIQAVINGAAAQVQNFFNNPNTPTQIAGGVFGALASVGSGLVSALIVTILTLYFTASLRQIKRGLLGLVPASRRQRVDQLSGEIAGSVGRYVIGQLTVATTNAVLSFIYLSIIRAPFPAVLAVIAFLFALIPLVGTFAGSLLITLLTLLLASPGAALAALIYYLIYMQVEAYVVSPNVMKRTVKVPGLVGMIAALIGGSLLGILGALIALPCAAAVMLIAREVIVPRQDAH